MRAWNKPSPDTTCPHCGVSYQRFMAGEFGRGNRREQSESGAVKRSLWQEHLAHCGLDRVPFDVPQTECPRKIYAAESLLRTYLSLGTAPASEILAKAQDAGIGARTLRIAKKALGVCSTRESSGNRGAGTWLWALPAERGMGQ